MHNVARKLRISSLLAFMSGMGSALFLYLSAGEPPDSGLIEEFQNSKVFRRGLEVYGGKMSVLGSRLSDWFTGLWQGKQLGITIGCISVAVSLLLLVIARLVPGDGALSGSE